MKIKKQFVSAIFLLFSFIIALSSGKQKADWKGKIKHENGIKVIKNPQEPLFNNANRKVHLKELMRIKDNGKDITALRSIVLLISSTTISGK